MKKAINEYIDHTNLRATATENDIRKLCAQAITHRFAAVCVNPCWVSLAASLCESSSVKVCTVVGFPLGANATEVKVAEAKLAITSGAKEIDMVINIGFLKSGRLDLVEKEIYDIVNAAKGVVVKVILETCYLTDEEKAIVCQLAKRSGAHFVKTSTGFGEHGATIHDVKLMRETVGSNMGVKASGGVRDFLTALDMIEAGACRIGTSSSVLIIEQAAQ